MKNKLLKLFDPSLKRNKNLMSLAMLLVTCCSTVLPVFATTAAGTIVGKIIDIVLGLFMLIGVILLVWAVGQLVLAFKNEDADSKSKAIMLLVVSCVLIGMKTVVNTLGLKSYISQAGI